MSFHTQISNTGCISRGKGYPNIIHLPIYSLRKRKEHSSSTTTTTTTIKAFIKKKVESDIVSWGFGYKAKPFTDYSPKALIPIHGGPAIDHLARYLSRFSCVSEIIIECEFDSFGKQIINYFEWKERTIVKRITFVEDKKKGTGGSILHVAGNVKDDGFFLVWFADDLCFTVRRFDNRIQQNNWRIQIPDYGNVVC